MHTSSSSENSTSGLETIFCVCGLVHSPVKAAGGRGNPSDSRTCLMGVLITGDRKTLLRASPRAFFETRHLQRILQQRSFLKAGLCDHSCLHYSAEIAQSFRRGSGANDHLQNSSVVLDPAVLLASFTFWRMLGRS